jgi:molybdenum cofactor biosynthesis enzyme MoaA
MYKEYVNSFKIVENRLVIPELHIPILTKCNLKCEYCAAFSPYSDDIFPTHDLIDSISNWATKIYPKELIITGGEPLLHPDCEKILIHIRSVWSYSKIRLISNGLLLNNVSDDFLQTVRNCNVSLSISEHLDSEGYRMKIKSSCEHFDQLGIKYTVYPSQKFWISIYKKDKDNFGYF